MKKILFTLMIATVLLFTGCTEGGDDVSNDATKPFVGGSKGLSMEFITGAPPDEVFDNNQYPFSVSVKLENLGEEDIEEGEGFLEIQGINPNEFGVSESDLVKDVPEIRGVRKNNDGSIVKGQSEVVTFDGLKFQQDIAGNFNIDTFRVRACYDYETRSTSQICIKEENIDSMKDDEICEINGKKSVVNSGGPLHIKSLTETSRGEDGIQIAFDVGEVGPEGSKWFAPGNTECDDRIDNPDLYKVEVEVEPIINERYQASCSGGTFNGGDKGTITLYGGEPRKVICSFDVGDQSSDFKTKVDINLRYRYLQSIDKSLLVKDYGVTEN
ncbi:MAG: hypothetical protein ACQER9_01745 [Nanobdellota archaeon]